MTDQHPLTDETCEDLSSCITIITAPGEPDPYICPQYIADDMRAAADWQLEQVIDWMRHSSESLVHRDWYLEAIGHCGAEMGIDLVIEDLRKAMRPTTTRGNN